MRGRKSNVESKRKEELSTNRKDFTVAEGDTIQIQDLNTGEFQYGCVEGTIEGNLIIRRITKEEAGPNPKRFTPRLPCSIDRSVTGSVVCSSMARISSELSPVVEDESPLPGHVTSWLCPVSNEELLEDE